MEFKDYERFGKELRELNDLLIEHICEISKKYKKSDQAIKHADKANKALMTLRSELEAVMFKQFPEQATIYVFYPKRDGSKET